MGGREKTLRMTRRRMNEKEREKGREKKMKKMDRERGGRVERLRNEGRWNIRSQWIKILGASYLWNATLFSTTKFSDSFSCSSFWMRSWILRSCSNWKCKKQKYLSHPQILLTLLSYRPFAVTSRFRDLAAILEDNNTTCCTLEQCVLSQAENAVPWRVS